MALFENFPYTNLGNLNLNWIIKKIKGIEDASDLIVDIPGYAQSCADAVTAAQGYKNDAQNAAGAAAGSASDALGYKNDAQSSANAAAGSASDALGYKNNAQSSAGAAAGSASDALGYKNAAEAAAALAATYTGFTGLHKKVEAGSSYTHVLPDGGYIIIDSDDIADVGYGKHVNMYYMEVVGGVDVGREPLATQQSSLAITYNVVGGTLSANNSLGSNDVYVTVIGIAYTV